MIKINVANVLKRAQTTSNDLYAPKKMTREEAKQWIQSEHVVTNYFASIGCDTNGRKFTCINPDHHDTNPSMSYYSETRKLRCFGKCNTSFDIFDVIAIKHGIPINAGRFDEIFAKACEIFNITIIPSRPASSSLPSIFSMDIGETIDMVASGNTSADSRKKTRKPKYIEGVFQVPGDQPSYSSVISDAASHADETDYFVKRGLSRSVVGQYRLGYMKHRHSNADYPVAVIPISDHGYVMRNTDDATSSGFRYKRTGKCQCYNPQNLKLDNTNEPIFITEGEFDVLSIIEVGGKAIGLGGIGNINLLLDFVKSFSACPKPTQPFIISLDNDDAGQKASVELCQRLKAIGHPCTIKNISGRSKDPNAALVKNKGNFKRRVKKTIDAVLQGKIDELNEIITPVPTNGCSSQGNANGAGVPASPVKSNTNAPAVTPQSQNNSYITSYCAAERQQRFHDAIEKRKNAPVISTGFPVLTEAFGGNLYSGLYIIGAESSIGKTSFALQIADQIAQQSKDVLFVSLEMPVDNLIGRSISRLTYIDATNSKTGKCKTTQEIIGGNKYASYSSSDLKIINSAEDVYFKSFSKHVYFYEGDDKTTTHTIREQIGKHIEATKNTPVVIVDYLQILSSDSPRADTKERIDATVSRLKQISRDFDIPVFAISSINRSSYNGYITECAYKESGAIEYSADVLIGLQFDSQLGRGEKSNYAKARAAFSADAKKGLSVDIALTILKNRENARDVMVRYKYTPKYNHFKEVSSDTEPLFSAGVSTSSSKPSGKASGRRTPMK